LIATGETLSTGGKAAHGDLDGAGAGAVFEERSEGFSEGLLACKLVAFCACCLSALAPSFKTTALGPTELINCGAGAFEEATGLGFSAVSTGVAGFCATSGTTSTGVNVLFVPSFHSMVSGAQSSSSSSMSAHFASFPSPSA
jgi:hypothetical protein